MQKDARCLPPGDQESGRDHRYRYATWDGMQWRDFEMAFAGTRLYAKEDDYTGLACIDPDDVSTVFASVNVHPVTEEPLISRADGQRHYEIFKGVTSDHGRTWAWTPVTANSSIDNLRPIVPQWNEDSTVVLWLRGTMRTFTDYDLSPVALMEHHSDRVPPGTRCEG